MSQNIYGPGGSQAGLKEIPDLDDVIEIGRPTKRYKRINVVDIASTTLAGPSHSRAIDNILSSADDGKSGRVVTFTGAAKVVQDGGTLLSDLLTSASLANYVQKSGATMTGDLDMGTHALLHCGAISGATNSRTADNLVSNAGTGAVGSLASFASDKVVQDAGITASNVVTNAGAATAGRVATFSANKVIQDGGTLLSSLATSAGVAAIYVPLAGATMTGDLDMGTHSLLHCGAISGATNSRTADNLVSNSGTGAAGSLASFASDKVVQDAGITASNVVTNAGAATAGRVATFSANKVIQDGGTLLSSLATSAGVAALYVPSAGGAMSGNLAMGNNQVTGVASFVPNNANTLIGNTVPVAAPSTRCVVIGGGSSVGGAGGSDGSVIVGNGSAVGSNAGSSQVIGDNHVVSGISTVVIGSTNTSSATKAHCFGSNLNNATANSLLIDVSANIRPSGNGACDLGTGSQKFKDAYINGNLQSSVNVRAVSNIVSNAGAAVNNGIAIFSGTTGKIIADSGATLAQYLPSAGGTMAGTLNMGNNPVTGATVVTQTTPIAYSVFSSTGGTVPVVAGVGKLISTVNATETFDPSNSFTITVSPNPNQGIITYTGATTLFFRVSVNYTVLKQNLAYVGFTIFLAKNGNLTPGNSSYEEWNVTTDPNKVSRCFATTVQLATNDTIQLACVFTATGGVDIGQISYNISQC